MRLIFALLVTVLFASACNLNNQPPTPTVPPPTSEATEETTSEGAPTSPAPTVTLLPGVNPTAAITRTPFGSLDGAAPTTQSIAATSAFPTPATGESVGITSPASGASISASPLYVSGVVHNLPEDRFTLQVFDGTGQSLTSPQVITLSNPNQVADVPWSASVQVRSYTGAAEIRITARIADGTEAVIGTVSVNIVPGNNQPQPGSGTPGNAITSPASGSSASGDPLTVTGSIGGVPENQFTLLLLDAGGTVINSQIITLSGAETNPVPWSASMGTSGYRGQAEIRAVTITNGQQTTLASVIVNLQ